MALGTIVNGFGAFVLAAAAGLNPWLTLLIVVGAAAYTAAAPLTPGFAPLAGNGPLVAVAVLLGLDVVGSKVPRLMRPTERLSGPAAAAVGALLCLALPNVALERGAPLAALAGAFVAFLFRLGRRWAALALRGPLQGYRFGYALTSVATNLLAAIMTAVTLAVGP